MIFENIDRDVIEGNAIGSGIRPYDAYALTYLVVSSRKYKTYMY